MEKCYLLQVKENNLAFIVLCQDTGRSIYFSIQHNDLNGFMALFGLYDIGGINLVDQIIVNLDLHFMRQTWLCGLDFYHHSFDEVIVLKKSFKAVRRTSKKSVSTSEHLSVSTAALESTLSLGYFSASTKVHELASSAIYQSAST